MQRLVLRLSSRELFKRFERSSLSNGTIFLEIFQDHDTSIRAAAIVKFWFEEYENEVQHHA